MNSRFEYTDDAQMVAEVISGNDGAIKYIFYENYTGLLYSNYCKKAKTYGVCFDDLVQELYLYLSGEDWKILRRYNPSKYPFANWFSVVSYRFFKDYVRSMIEPDGNVPIDDMNDHNPGLASRSIMDTLIMDIKEILRGFRPPRDREVLEAFLIRDEEPETVASRLGVTVDNIYNIKRRALLRLREMLKDYRE